VRTLAFYNPGLIKGTGNYNEGVMKQLLAFPAVRSVAYLALIASLAIYAIPATAQELPFTIGCMADEDKPNEIAFCKVVIAAADVYPYMRESMADDSSVLVLIVISDESEDGEWLAVAWHVSFSSAAADNLSISIVTGVEIVAVDALEAGAVAIIVPAFVHGARWLAPPLNQAPIRPPEILRLETSPP